jgi:predicted transposase YbfD/YdcC
MHTPSLSFFSYFGRLRVSNWTGRSPYRIVDLVFITLCATIANADNWVQIEAWARDRRDWLARFCELPRDEQGNPITPSHDTLERLFKRIDPPAFAHCFRRWTAVLAEKLGLKQIAIDGKTLCGSADPANGLRALHLVSAWSTENHLTLAEVAVDAKSNEITAIPLLLELLDVKGALVSIDAMGCQKKIAKKIVEGGGDYVLPVKANQERLSDDIELTFAAAAAVDFEGVEHDIYQTEERGHGRIERRVYIVIKQLGLIRDRDEWEKLTVVGKCFHEREVDGVVQIHDQPFIGSQDAGARVYGEAFRGHWGTENGQHWQLDVSFGEDGNQVANRNAAENLAQVRRLALGLLKRCPGKGSIKTKRYKAALNSEMVEQALSAA